MGILEIWNLSSRVQFDLPFVAYMPLLAYQTEHEKINSVSPRAHVMFSMSRMRNAGNFVFLMLKYVVEVSLKLVHFPLTL